MASKQTLITVSKIISLYYTKNSLKWYNNAHKYDQYRKQHALLYLLYCQNNRTMSG